MKRKATTFDLIMKRSNAAFEAYSAGRKRRINVTRGEGAVNEAQFQKQLADADHFNVVIDGDEGGVMMRGVVDRVQEAIKMREHYHPKYEYNAKIRLPTMVKGIYQFPENIPQNQRRRQSNSTPGVADPSEERKESTTSTISGSAPMRTWEQFAMDVQTLLLIVESTKCRKACDHRLGIIQERSRMFFMLNTDLEDVGEGLEKGGGVFSDVTKVDNSVRLSRLMNAQELLEFVVECYQRRPNDVIGKNSQGENITLVELLAEYGVDDPRRLTVAGLGWHPTSIEFAIEHAVDDTGRPKDKKAKPTLGQALLRYCASMKGLLFPLAIKRVMKRNDMRVKYLQASEYRISVYGSSRDELQNIAKFFKTNEIGPFQRNRWILHLRFVDRVDKDSHMGSGEPYADCITFEDQLRNFFEPLMNATLKPEENPALAWFLPQVGALHLEAFNPTGEEFDPKCPTPDEIPFRFEEIQEEDVEQATTGEDIAAQMESRRERRRSAAHLCELYHDYYVWANLQTLNQLRARGGLDPIQLRRGGGEGNLHNLLSGYLLSDMVTQCSKLADHPVLQYLYGLHRIGVAICPMFSTLRGNSYIKTPLASFLNRGLKVTLATEEPLHVHSSFDHLIEEYSTAQKLFRLSPLDMTEIARNSVLMSTFSRNAKEEWLGARYDKGTKYNSVKKSQVSNARLDLREEVWKQEVDLILEIIRQRSAGGGGGSASAEASAAETYASNLSSVKEVEYFAVLDSRIRFPRTVISGPQSRDVSTMAAAPLVAKAVQLRNKYIWEPPKPWHQRHGVVEEAFQSQTETFNEDDWTYVDMDGIFIPFLRRSTRSWPRNLPTLEDYDKDIRELKRVCDSIEVKDFAYRRLELLDSKFRLHLALNHANEAGSTDQKASSNRDLYHSYKVDTHVHMAAGMTARALREFMVEKIASHPDDIVMEDKDGKILTLDMLMRKYGISKDTLTTDQLAVHADHTLFERFDNFNNKYNPMAIADLRTLLLKTENYMNGRYFAELVQQTFDTYTRDRYTFAENRLSIYGGKYNEWEVLANWFTTHGMSSHHNKWIIQVPRVTYSVYHKMGFIGSYKQYLYNLFHPLWEASLHPAKHPRLHHFLNHISGFDSVDNESTFDAPFQPISPSDWTTSTNPPYGYHMYHLWANIRMLNEFRSYRGFPPFNFRPHCGESGADDHLLYTYLTADAINHGINLRNDPSIQYLYYVSQIGLAVSPLSNNALFLYFLNNPFPEFFRRGLNVSLSTDDPLMFHQTSEPLIEEYSIAAKVWGFSPNDMCEIARNSVLQSGYDVQWKSKAIGDRYYMSSSLGNDPIKTHLSDIRVAFRFETYHTELAYLEAVSNLHIKRAKFTSEEEQEAIEQQLSTHTEVVLLTTHDQEMEVIQRELEHKKELLKAARLELESLRKQNRNLVDSISELGVKLERERVEREEEANRVKKLPVKYEKTSENERLRQLTGSDRDAIDRVLNWIPRPPSAEVSGSPQTGRPATSGGLRLATRTLRVSRLASRPLPIPTVDGMSSSPYGSGVLTVGDPSSAQQESPASVSRAPNGSHRRRHRRHRNGTEGPHTATTDRVQSAPIQRVQALD
jgi:AMP deaminase